MAEIQDIFNQLDKSYGDSLNLTQRKAFTAIINCRTAHFGYHRDSCDHCDYEKFAYNSCRNRNCPKCQTFKKEQWIHKQEQYLLDIPYFHVVFTLPSELNHIAYQNQSVVYNLFFKAVSETLKELTFDEKYLGAKLGLTAILHTWGQNLTYHPHIHCIIPGGGLTANGKWKNSRTKFFLPVKVLSRKFRGKFLHYLKSAELNFYSSTSDLQNPVNFLNLISSLHQKEWVVYCKKPFGNAKHVISYLGRYTHRVAITNNRIISLNDNKVTFSWRDYRDSNKVKVMTLEAEEFSRRFLMHILPSGFHKIRHYGLLAPRDKLERIIICKRLTGTKIIPFKPKETEDLLRELIGIDFNKCPQCGIGKLADSPP